jgi:D-ribose pyranase
VDIALTDDIPTVLNVIRAVLPNFQVGRAFMAEEFSSSNTEAIRSEFERALAPLAISFEPHVAFKKRVPGAIGLIRTADTIQYANIIFESA